MQDVAGLEITNNGGTRGFGGRKQSIDCVCARVKPSAGRTSKEMTFHQDIWQFT